MNDPYKSVSSAISFLFISFIAFSQQSAFNQNSARSNHAKAFQGFDFQLTPQYAVNLNGNTVDSLFFRGNGGGFKMNAGYSFGNFGIGLTSGFLSSQTDRTKITEFISRAGVPPDNLTINTGNQQNMYLLFGPYAEFGNKIRAAFHAKGGLFINNSGLMSVQRKGASFPVYRNEASSKSVFPGFSAGIDLSFPVSDLISIGFNTDYLSTKSEVVNYDQRRVNAQGIVGEGLKLSKNISTLLAGISIKYNIKSPRDAASGLATGKQLGKPKYEDIKSSVGRNDGNAASAQYNPKELTIDKRKYQPGQPQYGNRTDDQGCGPVTKTITHPDGTTEEISFACPDDAAQYERISMNVTVPKQTQGATFGEKVNQGLHAAGSALSQGASRNIISGRAIWTSSNTQLGIITNQSIENNAASRTTQNTSFGTMVRMSARDASTGLATGKMFEPVYSDEQLIPVNNSLLEVRNPVYKGNNMEKTNPLYEAKARIASPDECGDSNPGIAGIDVALMDIMTGQSVAKTQTGKCGDFFFANVPDGNYIVMLSGMISGKKGYDIYLKSKMEVEGQFFWGGETVSLILYNNENENSPGMRAGISTSRSNIRTKSITIIDADTDGDGTFDSYRTIATLSDGSTQDITEDAAASRVNKVDAFTIKQKAFNKMHRLTRGKTTSSLQLTGITITDGENNKFKATAAFSDGSSYDVTNAVAVNSSNAAIKQYTIVVADLDDDGNADAVAKITKSRSNIQNNRMAGDNLFFYGEEGAKITKSRSNIQNNRMADDNSIFYGEEGTKITKSRSKIQNNRLIKGNEDDDQELGVVKTKTKSNQSNDRIVQEDDFLNAESDPSVLFIAVGDLDGDGKAEVNTDDAVAKATINTTRSNIKHLSVAIGDLNGDGNAEMLIGGALPGGAVISAALRSPGEPIPGIDVRFSKKSSSNERKASTDANGRLKIIGPDMEPDTYLMVVNNDIYINDATLVVVRGWNPEKKEMIESVQNNTKAQDHNSSRSNKTASIIDDNQNDDNTKAQDHNSSRSNKTANVVADNTENHGKKWTASEGVKSAINTSEDNLEDLSVTIDELELLLNNDNVSSRAIVNTSRSNIKAQRAAATALQNTLYGLETMDKAAAMKEVASKMNVLNLQMTALQNTVKQLGRQYTTVSNVLKTKHDTAKNSVGNIR